MNLILFDTADRGHLLPLAYTRPIAGFRVGIFTIAEKWELALKAKASFLVPNYLSKKYPAHAGSDNLYINGSILPDADLLSAIRGLQMEESLSADGVLIAWRTAASLAFDFTLPKNADSYNQPVSRIQRAWDVFSKNGDAIQADFSVAVGQAYSQTREQLIENGVVIRGKYPVFVHPTAKVTDCIINSANGPVYIGPDAEVMEGCTIRGPLAMLDHSVLKMGAKIYGPTTLGPYCKVGGELNNVVLFGYSNKAHDGFLGNAVIGEWCNLGADTNNSNLKNNYAPVKVWNEVMNRFEPTGLTFCGLIMADHSKCGINTMFNTGTVVGVSANVFGSGFPRNMIPGFSWGGAGGFETFQLPKVYEASELMMERRGLKLDEIERELLSHIFELTAPARWWETKK